MLDGIVEGTLILCILVINICAQLNQQFDRANVTLTCSVVDRRLPVLVLPVHIVLADVDQVLNGRIVTLATRVKDRSLLKRVLFDAFDSHLSQHLDHLEGSVMVRHHTG